MDQAKINEVKQLELKTLEELEEMKKNYMKAVREQGTDIVKAEFAKVFAKYPDLKVVAWVQYTPYFNDGDACVFSVREFNGGVEELSPADIASLPKYIEMEEDLGFYGSAENYKDYSAEGETFKKYGTRWNSSAGYPFDQELFDRIARADEGLDEISSKLADHDDLLKMAFGDHVQVIATPAGFTVKDIDHD